MTNFRDQLAVAVTCKGLHIRERIFMAYMMHCHLSSLRAWPSTGQIANLTGTTRQCVQKYRRQLEQLELLCCTVPSYGGRGRSPVYRVCPTATEHSFQQICSTVTKDSTASPEDAPENSSTASPQEAVGHGGIPTGCAKSIPTGGS